MKPHGVRRAAVATALVVVEALTSCAAQPTDMEPAPTESDGLVALPPPVIEAARAVVAISSEQGQSSGVMIRPDLFMTAGDLSKVGCKDVTVDAQTPGRPVRVPVLHVAGRYEGDDPFTRQDRGLVYAPSVDQPFAELPTAQFGSAPSQGSRVYAVTWQKADAQDTGRNPLTSRTDELKQPSVLSLRVLGTTNAGTLLLKPDGYGYDITTGRVKNFGDTTIKSDGGGNGGGVFEPGGNLVAEISASVTLGPGQKDYIERLLGPVPDTGLGIASIAVAQLADPNVLG